MKAAKELLPVGMRVAVELDEPWQKSETHTERKRSHPRDARCLAVRQKLA
jgi:hypothetical protein